MKTYATEAIAKQIATKAAKKTGISHQFGQTGTVWAVGTSAEWEALAAKTKPAKKEKKAKSEGKPSAALVAFHHQTKNWLVGVFNGAVMWFEKASLISFEVQGDKLQIVASEHYMKYKFK